jgi:hypothetical protein
LVRLTEARSYGGLVEAGFKVVRLQDALLVQGFARLDLIRSRNGLLGAVVAIEEQCLGRGMLEEPVRAGNHALHEAQVEKDLSQVAEGDVVIPQGRAAVLSSGREGDWAGKVSGSGKVSRSRKDFRLCGSLTPFRL